MAQKEYDTYILTDPNAYPEDQRLELIVRDLNPDDRRFKYRSFFAQANISKSKDRYPDLLWIRLGRGQLQAEPWSIEILEEVNKFA
jgi:phenylphosphate carboxylase gamma subunit